MDEESFRTILKAELATFEDELRSDIVGVEHRLRDEIVGVEHRLRDEIVGSERRLRGEFRTELAATEARLAENGRMQFRQLADLYRATNERIDRMDKHLSDRLDQTRASIEALRSALEHQDFRTDELARRVTALETRPTE